ncbi:chitinase [Schizosaccharomyces octosporus yFS286]|uniref:Chitinase n=1 Tax=Schizosaccharomyces octosporus (strain yFS286) TaxID=483514 RepID=S9PXH5_SCHOY|nr:chitinase [Schizosaccharomyces octosporus yFS286]EPX72163.1 chitinase [Schizosaccharomyces octosporus yFS286]
MYFVYSLLVLAVLSQVSRALNVSDRSSVVNYWSFDLSSDVGYGDQKRLANYCESSKNDIVVLSSVIDFNTSGWPIHDFSKLCSDGEKSNDADLKHCPQMEMDIQTCQKNGIKVLLSIGGLIDNSTLDDEEDGPKIASQLWNVFGGGEDVYRPFGKAVVDGFNLEVSEGNNATNTASAKQFFQIFASNPDHKYHLSTATPIARFNENMPMNGTAKSYFAFLSSHAINSSIGVGNENHNSTSSSLNVNKNAQSNSTVAIQSTSASIITHYTSSMITSDNSHTTVPTTSSAPSLLKSTLPSVNPSPISEARRGIMTESFDIFNTFTHKVPFQTLSSYTYLSTFDSDSIVAFTSHYTIGDQNTAPNAGLGNPSSSTPIPTSTSMSSTFTPTASSSPSTKRPSQVPSSSSSSLPGSSWSTMNPSSSSSATPYNPWSSAEPSSSSSRSPVSSWSTMNPSSSSSATPYNPWSSAEPSSSSSRSPVSSWSTMNPSSSSSATPYNPWSSAEPSPSSSSSPGSSWSTMNPSSSSSATPYNPWSSPMPSPSSSSSPVSSWTTMNPSSSSSATPSSSWSSPMPSSSSSRSPISSWSTMNPSSSSYATPSSFWSSPMPSPSSSSSPISSWTTMNPSSSSSATPSSSWSSPMPSSSSSNSPVSSWSTMNPSSSSSATPSNSWSSAVPSSSPVQSSSSASSTSSFSSNTYTSMPIATSNSVNSNVDSAGLWYLTAFSTFRVPDGFAWSNINGFSVLMPTGGDFNKRNVNTRATASPLPSATWSTIITQASAPY